MNINKLFFYYYQGIGVLLLIVPILVLATILQNGDISNVIDPILVVLVIQSIVGLGIVVFDSSVIDRVEINIKPEDNNEKKT